MDPQQIVALLTKYNINILDGFQEYIDDFVWFGIALFIAVYISHALWTWSAELQGRVMTSSTKLYGHPLIILFIADSHHVCREYFASRNGMA